jgi:LuxR family maltose regulon positive regulatory protein
LEEQPTLSAVIQATKLVPPTARADWVPRPELLRALMTEARLILVDAPVGYGKSTLLAQWCSLVDGDASLGWLSLDAADSDPARLIAHLVESMRLRVPGFGSSIGPALDVTGDGVSEAVLCRLIDELAAIPGRVVIVLDDYHLLRGRSVHALMTRVVMGLPAATQLVVATRADPPLPLGRLRASGDLVELRSADLRFDERVAARLLDSVGVALAPADLSALVERTEGWPAGLYLAALLLRTEANPAAFVRNFEGSHRHIADYLSEQVLQRESGKMRTFLRRTSVLQRMCGPLCDALLGVSDSQRVLENLEQSNLFIVPLDDARRWYRYHQLFGQMLQADLARTEPERRTDLHRRASDWFDAAGLQEEAVEHALAAGDEIRSARLIAHNWLGLFNSGRLETVRRWLDDLGEDVISTQPAVALTAAWIEALDGDAEGMERWLTVAESAVEAGRDSDGTDSVESGAALIRGLFGYCGLEARRAWLARAWELEPVGSAWRPYLLWGLGHVALLSGDPVQAMRLLSKALRLATSQHAVLSMITLAEIAIAEAELGHKTAARLMVRRAEAIAEERGLAGDSRSSSVALALGVVSLAEGNLTAGHEALERALELRRSTGQLSPWPTLEILATLAPVRLRSGDIDGARFLVAEARAMLADLSDAGVMPRRLDDTERLLARSRGTLTNGQSLTARELEILRLLPSHLSQSEIGGKLFLSLNTIKTHNRAIYRKLGVSSRRGAVERARELNLL